MDDRYLTAIVDDDPIFRTCFEMLLTEVEFAPEILNFEHGAEALEGLANRLRLGEPLPQVLFLDLNMPVMDGWDFLSELRGWPVERTEKLAIFILSSSIKDDDLMDAERHPLVQGYIPKPPVAADLAKVRAALSPSRQRA